MTNNNKNDDGAIECVMVKGVAIDLRTVSPLLRQQYHSALRAVGRHEKAKDELTRVGEAILAEQALKIAPLVRGDHAVAAKLMKLAR